MSDGLPRIEPLKLGNYPTWQQDVTAWLCFRGWWTIVNGNYKRPAATDSSAPTKDETNKINAWDTMDVRSAGAIAITLSRGERDAIHPTLVLGPALWIVLKTRHIVDKPTVRYNAYSKFFVLQLAPGELLDAFGGRIKATMRGIQDPGPTGYDIATFNKDLQSIAIICALSEEPSCCTLVAMLLGDNARLADLTLMGSCLMSEDIGCNTTPAPYGLKKNEHGILLAIGTAPATMPIDKANAATMPAKKKDKLKCTHCSRCHLVDKCYQKRIADLEKHLGESVRVATESAGSTITACAPLLPSLPDVADDLWIADTGATAHMTPHWEFFVTYELRSTLVHFANGNVLNAAGVGTVAFMPRLNGNDMPAVGFTRVLHVPGLQCNLLSVLHLVRHKQFIARAENASITFSRAGTLIFTARVTDAFAAYLNSRTLRGDSAIACAYCATLPLNLALWHRRTMHHHIASLECAVRNKMVMGMTIDLQLCPDPVCEPCLAGKMHTHPFRSTGTIMTGVLDLVHGNLIQMPVCRQFSYWYFISFHNGHLGFHVAYPLAHKSDTFEVFCMFKVLAETHTGCKIKAFQDDKGEPPQCREVPTAGLEAQCNKACSD